MHNLITSRSREVTSKNLIEAIDYSKEGIISKVILKENEKNVTLFCMSKGTEISEHTSTKQGFVYVIEGEGIFVLEGYPKGHKEEIKMTPGVFISMNENAIHSLKAKENTSFLLMLNGGVK